MTRMQVTKTSFTSGEIDPEMLGRIELRAYEEGAAKLRNVVVKPTGGVGRRPGTRHVSSLGNVERLIPLDTRDGELLVVLSQDEIVIRDNDGVVQSGLEALWRTDELNSITWTHIDGGLLICHGDVEPRQLKLDQAGDWTIGPWEFETLESENGDSIAQPYAKLVASQVAVQPTNLNVVDPDEADAIPQDSDIRLLATEPLFEADHLGTIFRIKGREVRIQSVISSVEARAIVLQELIDGKTTRFFEEQVFSDARGWPAAVTRYQDRLVIGGAQDAADQIWFSKTGDYFNFDLGTGLDDEAISFQLSDSRLHRIRQFAANRHLQVMTNLGEWVVSGNPLTPSSIQLDLQTNVGSPADRQIKPLEVDGATLFVGASKRDIREFLYADTEQAFQAPDIALLSRHLINGPREMAFWYDERLLAIVLDSGEVATATIDRNANIVAWTLQNFGGSAKAITLFDGSLYLVIERNGQRFLESLSVQALLDGAIEDQDTVGRSLWNGFTHQIGQVVRVVADGVDLGDFLVTSDTLDIGIAANSIQAGFEFEHVIEPLPISSIGNRAPLDTLYRPVRSVFRVIDCQSLRIDTARGQRSLIDPSETLSPLDGDFAIRDYGWRRGQGQWAWRIRQSDPQPFTLLSATTEIKVNN